MLESEHHVLQIAPWVRPQVKWKHYKKAINYVRFDGINESAENVPRRFLLLMNIVKDEESMMPTDLLRIRPWGGKADGAVPTFLGTCGKGRAHKAGHQPHISTFPHFFATHLLESGSDIRTVQELLGHRDVNKTMISPHYS